MKIEFDVDSEVFDKLLVEALKDQHSLCAPEVGWCDEDKKYNKKMRKHLEAVLKHNMFPEEFRKWKLEVKRLEAIKEQEDEG